MRKGTKTSCKVIDTLFNNSDNNKEINQSDNGMKPVDNKNKQVGHDIPQCWAFLLTRNDYV